MEGPANCAGPLSFRDPTYNRGPGVPPRAHVCYLKKAPRHRGHGAAVHQRLSFRRRRRVIPAARTKLRRRLRNLASDARGLFRQREPALSGLVHPHVWRGLPRLPSRSPKVDSSALRPVARKVDRGVAGPRNDRGRFGPQGQARRRMTQEGIARSCCCLGQPPAVRVSWRVLDDRLDLRSP